MKKYIVITIIIVAFFLKKTDAQPFIRPPKLVVGIVVDQMRHDYIRRYWNLFSDNGFKKLIQNGYTFENAHYNYFPTYTAAGHAHIVSGASPGVNGIVGNDWWNTSTRQKIYCVSDSSVNTVGSNTKAGKMSPKNLLTTTFGDELRLASNFNSRVYTVAIKDRGAILMGGHTANAAYWMDPETGSFISSTFYMNDVPKWVKDFNQKKLWDKYLDNVWKLSLPADKIEAVSTTDNNAYENLPKGNTAPVFPYNLKEIRKQYNAELLAYTPWGNTYTFDFAEELLRKEFLGEKNQTDVLLISLSTPDYMGHQYGPRAMEMADMYARLDRDLASFITTLETRLGRDNILLFLTADHGAADNPTFSADHKIPGGIIPSKMMEEDLKAFLKAKTGVSVVQTIKNMQVYLDHEAIQREKLKLDDILALTEQFMQHQEGIYRTVSSKNILQAGSTDEILTKYQRGYFPGRSGDIILIPLPGWLDMPWQTTGTTHGSAHTYDTHVPLIFYGKDVATGYSYDWVAIANLAPTITATLGIQNPSGCFDIPLLGYFRQR